ncbi:hypothetical protein HS7_18560 [Sulfolobales archaeon HS-7]|nr:hypothetical protein HS7_18560 [Sulfolobales archaeon HS-7]
MLVRGPRESGLKCYFSMLKLVSRGEIYAKYDKEGLSYKGGRGEINQRRLTSIGRNTLSECYVSNSIKFLLIKIT